MLALPFRSFRLAVRSSPALIAAAVAVAGTAGGIGASATQAEAVFTSLSLPTITGTAVEGETLSETPATWSTQPVSVVVRWQRCNTSGNDCQSASEATGKTYRLSAADVGFTIRAVESAKNAAGAVTPAISEPTAAVQAHAADGHGGGQGNNGNNGGGAPPTSCCGAPIHVSSAKIKSLLARQLMPSRRASSISALLRHGGLSMSFTFPEAGALQVRWYLVPSGARHGGKGKAKPMLLATGQTTFSAAQTAKVKIRLTARGSRLLRHAAKIRLEAKGAFAPKGEAVVSATKTFALKR
jgi:hypothetical protein